MTQAAVTEPIPGSKALEAFCGQDGTHKEFTGELRSILEVIATTGKYWHNWSQLRTLFCFRLTQVLREYYDSNMQLEASTGDLVHGERFSDMLDRLIQGLESFTNGAPFTSQRLCELLLNPKDTYVNLDKLALAFEKLLLVTSTEAASTDPYPSSPPEQPPMKGVEPVVQKEVQQGGTDDVVPAAAAAAEVSAAVNGTLEGNGEHVDVQDVEMVDADGASVDRSSTTTDAEAEVNRPPPPPPDPVPVPVPVSLAAPEGVAVSNDFSPQNGNPAPTAEEPSNGHVVVPMPEEEEAVVEELTLGDIITE